MLGYSIAPASKEMLDKAASKPLRYVIIGEPGAIDLVERAQAANGVLILTDAEMALWDRCVRVLP